MTAEKRQHENTLIRPARAGDAPAFGQLLHAFNAEFGQSEPDKETIVNRAAPLIESGEVTVLFAGEGQTGSPRFASAPSPYTVLSMPTLEELYVVPERRGHGLGRALLEAAMDHARSAALPASTSTQAWTTSPPTRSTRVPDLRTASFARCRRRNAWRSRGSRWRSDGRDWRRVFGQLPRRL
jgi:GNAT superfamily N-acetyltransferase